MNKKRVNEDNARLVLGRVLIRREHIKVIEKIIKKRLRSSDFYIEVGRPKYFGVIGYPRYTENHARYLSKDLHKYRYLRIRTKLPNLKIEFSPLKTVITAQRVYSKGKKLSKVDETVEEIRCYLEIHRSTRYYVDFYRLNTLDFDFR
jgi:hypothetical protein